MPPAIPPSSESESERVPSKKQKKREESPADDPMDEDQPDGDEGDEDEEEYEIEKILDSKEGIFKDEIGYFVKWKGYPSSENSWVKESDAMGAADLISKFLDEKTARERAAKKASSKSRKATETHKPEPKKRGRVSVRSKADSDDEIPERSPVQPIAKKQKKEKTTASARKEVEPTSEDDLNLEAFAPMDKYMHLDSWDDLVDKIDTIERDEGGGLFIYGMLTTKENFRLSSSVANAKFPQKIIKFYEENLRWKVGDEAT